MNIKKAISNKVALVEVALGFDFNSPWVPYSPGIYSNRLYINEEDVAYDFGTGAFGYGIYGESGTTNIEVGEKRVEVASLYIIDEFYTKVESIDDLYAVPKSFYWDSFNQTLYVRFKDWNSPSTYSPIDITIGIKKYFSSKAGYWNNYYWEGRIDSIPDIKRSRDPLYFGDISFDGGSIKINNADGELDSFADEDFYGQEVEIKYGEYDDEYEDFETIYVGYIENIEYTEENVQLKIGDTRKKLKRSVPTHHYSVDDYPNLKEDDDGSPVFVGFGILKGVEPQLLNGEEDTPTTYDFKLLDTTYGDMKSIDTIWVKIDGDWVAKTATTSDLTLGTFSLSNTDYTGGEDIKVDCQGLTDDEGTLIDNPLDIIVFLLSNYLSIVYHESIFNIEEWEESREKVLGPISLLLKDEKEIIDIISEICVSTLGYFIIEDDGRYTFRISDNEVIPTKTIYVDEMLEAPKITHNTGEYLSSVRVLYSQDFYTDDYKQYVNKSREQEIQQRYKMYNDKEWKTLLVNKANALTLSNTLIDAFERIKPIFSIPLKTQHYDVKIGEVVYAQVYKKGNIVGEVKGEVISIIRSIIDGKMRLDVRKIEDVVDDVRQWNYIKTIDLGVRQETPLIIEYDVSPDYLIEAGDDIKITI